MCRTALSTVAFLAALNPLKTIPARTCLVPPMTFATIIELTIRSHMPRDAKCGFTWFGSCFAPCMYKRTSTLVYRYTSKSMFISCLCTRFLAESKEARTWGKGHSVADISAAVPGLLSGQRRFLSRFLSPSASCSKHCLGYCHADAWGLTRDPSAVLLPLFAIFSRMQKTDGRKWCKKARNNAKSPDAYVPFCETLMSCSHTTFWVDLKVWLAPRALQHWQTDQV